MEALEKLNRFDFVVFTGGEESSDEEDSSDSDSDDDSSSDEDSDSECSFLGVNAVVVTTIRSSFCLIVVFLSAEV